MKHIVSICHTCSKNCESAMLNLTTTTPFPCETTTEFPAKEVVLKVSKIRQFDEIVVIHNHARHRET